MRESEILPEDLKFKAAYPWSNGGQPLRRCADQPHWSIGIMKLLSELREDIRDLPCFFCGAPFDSTENRILSFRRGKWIMFHSACKNKHATHNDTTTNLLGPIWEHAIK